MIITAEEGAGRLDKYLVAKSGLTRSRIQSMVEHSLVLVNGEPAARAGQAVRAGDLIELSDESPNEGVLVAEDLPLEVLFMDDDLAVVNKPAGMVVYPAPGHASGTLLNALAYRAPHLATVGAPLRPGVVHRLDRDTSGVMVVALSDEAYYSLVEQFRLKETGRRYMALLYGKLPTSRGETDKPIGRASSDRKRMSTHTRRGKEAKTSWRVIERLGPATLIEAILGTGRTHQIRVHMTFSGHPVLGDQTYGKKTSVMLKNGLKLTFPRQMLHARSLAFRHPRTGVEMEFLAPPPRDMEDAISSLRGSL